MEGGLLAKCTDCCELWLNGFSCPNEKFDEQFFELLVSEYLRNLTRIFLDRYRERIRHRSGGVIPLLERWVDPEPVTPCLWDPCFGDALLAMHNGDSQSAPSIAAAVALHLGMSGVPGNWSIELDQPAHLRWGGYILQVGNTLRLTADGDRAFIEIGTDSSRERVSFRRFPDGWFSPEARPLPSVDLYGRKSFVLPKEVLSLPAYPHLLDATVEELESKSVAILQRAVELIREHAPLYRPWVRRAISHFFLLKPLIQRVESGSIEHYPGLVHLSAYSRPEPMAELLVHEASHQHFNLICRLGRFDDGSDTREYYSPAVYRNRPLNRIGIAYHAFGNTLLFYGQCMRSADMDAPHMARRLATLQDEVGQLEAPLRGNSALTAIGRALCDPLIKHLNE